MVFLYVGRGPTPREGFLFYPHPNPPQRGGSKNLNVGTFGPHAPGGILRAKPLVWGLGIEDPQNRFLLPPLWGGLGWGYQS